jgi:hypothetical protein
MTNTADVAAITEVVRTYVTAMTTGDRAALERIFHENAAEVGHFEGDLLWNPREGFIRMCEEAADASVAVWWEIRSIAVHGDIAVAHVQDDWAGMRFDDILTLVHHDGTWRITAKAFRIQTGAQ